jgi:phosphatidylinositol alpha-1,6-mannosyltransferase
MRPRILVVTPEFPPQWGGIGTHCYEMARHWARSADVTVLAPASGGPRPDGGYRLVELPPTRGKFARLLATARAAGRLLGAGGFDMAYVLHWRTSGVAYRLAAAGSRRRPPYVQAVHDGEVLGLLAAGAGNRAARWLFRWTLGGAAWIVASGEYQVAMLERLGVGRERVFLSTYGVDAAGFAADAGRIAALRRRYGVEGCRVLLTVSRLVPHKGHDMVIRALPAILDRAPDTVYLIVGTGPNADALRALAQRTGVAHRVRFAGGVPGTDLAAHYHLCDIFIMASREEGGDTEGFGIVFAEAAACGRPAIGGRTGGTVQAVLDGRTGLLVDPRSPDDIADAALRLLDDRDLAARLGEAGRRRVLDEMQYEDIAARVLAACGPSEEP